MILEDKWSWKRFRLLFAMAAVTAAMSAGISFFRGTERGEWLIYVLCSCVFFVLLALHLEWNRREKGYFHEKSNNYARIAKGYLACCIFTAAISFLPGYARPIMPVAMMMTIVSTPFTGLLCGAYCSVLLTIGGTGDIALLSCYLLLCGCGCILIEYSKNSKNQLWGSFMILTVTFCMTLLFSLAGMTLFSWRTAVFGIVSGLLSGALALLLVYLWKEKIEKGRELVLKKIVKEQYVLAQMMKNYSAADYDHARKVSKIAAGCAAKLDINAPLAAAAGLYYRVGRLEGEPYVENGVLLARKHKFPPELIQILGEYNGEKLLPSTVESALVHIVDHVVAKFDVLDKNTLSSSWNQDIVVYQTLNENSAKGLYDKSGLGMNMFLIIRDYLIKEAGLYDNHH